MKKRKKMAVMVSVAITLAIIVVIVALLVKLRYGKAPSPTEDNRLIVKTVYSPPLEWMRDVNVRPDTMRCPMDSPVQAFWNRTQRLSLEDALATDVEEYKSSLIYMSKSKDKRIVPYYTSVEEQKEGAREEVGMKVWGVLEYLSLYGEAIAFVIFIDQDGNYLCGGLLVDRGKGYRYMMNIGNHGGIDVNNVFADLYLRFEDDQYDPNNFDRDTLSAIAAKAVKEAQLLEQKELDKVQKVKLKYATTVKVLREEAEKCRLFLLGYPKSLHCGVIRDRLDAINGFLTYRKKPTIKPYANYEEYMEIVEKRNAAKSGIK